MQKKNHDRGHWHPLVIIVLLCIFLAPLGGIAPKNNGETLVARVSVHDQTAVALFFGGRFAIDTVHAAMAVWDSAVVKDFRRALLSTTDGWDKRGKINQNFDDRGVQSFASRYVHGMLAVAALAIYRIVVVLVFVVLTMPLWLSIVVDGGVRRQIKKWQFNMPSMMARNGAKSLGKYVSLLVFLGLFLPLNESPMILPVLALLVAMASWWHTANLRKNI